MLNLPQYRCHKVVGAVLINAIDHKANPDTTGKSSASSYGAIITPKHSTLHAFEVSDEYMIKHKPQVGGYYVLYEDGYASFSPAAAFESGYHAIHEQPSMDEGKLIKCFSFAIDGDLSDEKAIKVLQAYITQIQEGDTEAREIFMEVNQMVINIQ